MRSPAFRLGPNSNDKCPYERKPGGHEKQTQGEPPNAGGGAWPIPSPSLGQSQRSDSPPPASMEGGPAAFVMGGGS